MKRPSFRFRTPPKQKKSLAGNPTCSSNGRHRRRPEKGLEMRAHAPDPAQFQDGTMAHLGVPCRHDRAAATLLGRRRSAFSWRRDSLLFSPDNPLVRSRLAHRFRRGPFRQPALHRLWLGFIPWFTRFFIAPTRCSCFFYRFFFGRLQVSPYSIRSTGFLPSFLGNFFDFCGFARFLLGYTAFYWVNPVCK